MKIKNFKRIHALCEAQELKGKNMVRHQKQTRKQQLKNNWKVVIMLVIALGMVALGMMVEDRREANRQTYAKTHNCTWHYTGTFYGDNRDSICK